MYIFACTNTQVFRQNQYSETSDVYSLGIILWEVLARKKPYYELINVHPHNLVKMIKGMNSSADQKLL